MRKTPDLDFRFNSWYCEIFKNTYQASAYEKQGRAIVARLVTKFRGYRRVKRRTPPTKQVCGGLR